jgi:hypothetical protein
MAWQRINNEMPVGRVRIEAHGPLDGWYGRAGKKLFE